MPNFVVMKREATDYGTEKIYFLNLDQINFIRVDTESIRFGNSEMTFDFKKDAKTLKQLVEDLLNAGFVVTAEDGLLTTTDEIFNLKSVSNE